MNEQRTILAEEIKTLGKFVGHYALLMTHPRMASRANELRNLAEQIVLNYSTVITVEDPIQELIAGSVIFEVGFQLGWYSRVQTSMDELLSGRIKTYEDIEYKLVKRLEASLDPITLREQANELGHNNNPAVVFGETAYAEVAALGAQVHDYVDIVRTNDTKSFYFTMLIDGFWHGAILSEIPDLRSRVERLLESSLFDEARNAQVMMP